MTGLFHLALMIMVMFIVLAVLIALHFIWSARFAQANHDQILAEIRKLSDSK